jgi:hypothetical protein
MFSFNFYAIYPFISLVKKVFFAWDLLDAFFLEQPAGALPFY